MNNNSQNYENKSEEGSDVRQCELIEDERNHCEIEKLKFQIEVLTRKISVYENSMKKMSTIEHDYEMKFSSLISEYKNKEDEMRAKYKAKEDALYNEAQAKENEYEKQFTMMKNEMKRLKDIALNYEKEIEKTRMKSQNIDTNIKMKDREYSAIISQKDKRISDLESELNANNLQYENERNELKAQNAKLAKEISEMRREQYSTSFSANLQTRKQNTSTTLQNENVNKEKRNENCHSRSISNIDSISKPSLTAYDINKIKELREKITSLEKETVDLTRELSLKYEECDALNDEIVRLRSEIKTNHISSYNKANSIFVNNITNANQNDIANDIKIANLEMALENYGRTLMALKQRYDDLVRENEEKMEKVCNDYNIRIEQLMAENNELKRGNNKNGFISSTMKNTKLSPKDINELIGEQNNNLQNEKNSHIDDVDENLPNFMEIDSQIKEIKNKINNWN